MLNARSIEQVDAARLPGGLARPLYEGYAFAQIPATVERLLAGVPGGLPDAALDGLPDRPHAVLLVLLDAFGWTFLERHGEHPLLRRLVRRGTVSKLSSQFPSTTAAHVTTLHTGLPVTATGIYEWFMYEPVLGELIAPLLFSPAGDHGQDHLRAAGADPLAVFPWETLAQRLAAAGVAAHAVQPAHITGSAYGGAVLRGAEQHGYHAIEEAFAICARLLRSAEALLRVRLLPGVRRRRPRARAAVDAGGSGRAGPPLRAGAGAAPARRGGRRRDGADPDRGPRPGDHRPGLHALRQSGGARARVDAGALGVRPPPGAGRVGARPVSPCPSRPHRGSGGAPAEDAWRPRAGAADGRVARRRRLRAAARRSGSAPASATSSSCRQTASPCGGTRRSGSFSGFAGTTAASSPTSCTCRSPH